MTKLSVIIPAYNEEKRIGATVLATDAYLKHQNYDYEIIVVDNHSSDQTTQVVQKLAATEVHVKVMQQPIRGKGAAVMMGIQAAVGEYVMFMDADNATPISEIQKFWPVLQSGVEVVIGDRYLDQEHRAKQPWMRTILSRGSNLLIQLVLTPNVHDTQAGFKAFQGRAAKEIFKHITIYGFAFDMELLEIAIKLGYRIQAVGIIRVQEGGSSVPPMAFLLSLRDLFIIKWNALLGKYSTK